jgi:MFS family permease
MADRRADEPLAVDEDQRRRAAKFRVLTTRFACRAASQLLVRNTWDSLWLLAFSDVGEQAVVRGNVNAATELLTFLVTPIISSFTDAYGRRAGQVFCAACNLVYHICGLTLGLHGSVAGLVVGQFFFAIAQQGQTLQRASMGDLYMSDPVQYTSALSKMELCCEPHSPVFS